MKTKFKSAIFITFLTCLMFLSFNSFGVAKETPNISATTALGLGTSKSFSYTNETQIASFEVNFTGNHIYRINVTNDKGCDLSGRVHWPDYREEHYYFDPNNPDVFGTDLTEINSYLTTFNLEVTGASDWNSTTESFLYFPATDMTVIVDIYGDGKNSSLAWEDLGGSVRIDDMTSKLINSIIPATNGWSSSLNTTEFGSEWILQTINVTETGFYDFTLNSTANLPYVSLYSENPYLPDVLTGATTMLMMNDYNESVNIATPPYNNKELVDVEHLYLPEGVYYLSAYVGDYFPIDYEYAAWDLDISKAPMPTVSNSTSSITFDSSNVEAKDGTLNVTQGILVENIVPDHLYDFSVTCPGGYNLSVSSHLLGGLNKRGENKTESGVIMIVDSALPTFYNINGLDVPNSMGVLAGTDEDIADTDDIDRSYMSRYPGGSYDMNLTATGLSIPFYVTLTNYSADFTDVSVDFTFETSSSQPGVLDMGTDTYSINHISDSDDEGIYKLNASKTVGQELGFIMNSMGDYAHVEVDFLSNWIHSENGDIGYYTETQEFFGINSFEWYNSTFDNHSIGYYYDIDPEEISIFTDTWVIIQDDMNMGYPNQNTTTFSMTISNKSAYKFNSSFNKPFGDDLIMIDGALPSASHIHIQSLGGTIEDANPSYYPFYDISLTVIAKDGTYYSNDLTGRDNDWIVSTGRDIADYYLLIRMDTDESDNIGTYKVHATYLESAVEGEGFEIPGYPIYAILGVTAAFIGIVAYLQKRKK